jgi:hypothetical protein
MPHPPSEATINALIQLVEGDNASYIKQNANGGNSVLIRCNPAEEHAYITTIRERLLPPKYTIIDIGQLLTDFAVSHEAEIKNHVKLVQSIPHAVFKKNPGERRSDFFDAIIGAISGCFAQKSIPVLIDVGALWGTKIDNIHIMEHEVVMRSGIPLLVLYPATKDGDTIHFLGVRPASRYRCMMIND